MDTFDSIARANPEYVEALYRQYRGGSAFGGRELGARLRGLRVRVAARSERERDGDERQPPVADLVHSYRELRASDRRRRSARTHARAAIRCSSSASSASSEADLDRTLSTAAAFRGLGDGAARAS